MSIFAIVASVVIGVIALLYMNAKESPVFWLGWYGMGCLVLLGLGAIVGTYGFLLDYVFDNVKDDELRSFLGILLVIGFIGALVSIPIWAHFAGKTGDKVTDLACKRAGKAERALTMDQIEWYFYKAKRERSYMLTGYINGSKLYYPDGRRGHRGAITIENITFDPNDKKHVDIAKGEFQGTHIHDYIREARAEVRQKEWRYRCIILLKILTFGIVRFDTDFINHMFDELEDDKSQ